MELRAGGLYMVTFGQGSKLSCPLFGHASCCGVPRCLTLTISVLVPNTPWREPGAGTNSLFVIDWEFTQYGHRAYDLGQMIGDLYERSVFNGIDTFMPVMHGFIEGYGETDSEMAFRTAIHAGVHMIGWYNRRSPTSPLGAPPEVVVAGLTNGRDLILKGWERDRKFFESSVLASLFATKSSGSTVSFSHPT